MDFFLGTYACTIDEKNRLSIPAKIRKVMTKRGEQSFILTGMDDSCLTLYPYSIWKTQIADRIAALPQSSDAAKRLRRLLGKSTMEVPLDNQGRIVVPADLCKHARIEKKVTIFGAMDKVEIWNPEVYQEVAETPEEQSAGEELKTFGI
ncbi:MAG: division/cell wall cluster transcriptional repressor MraZ [bacterium]